MRLGALHEELLHRVGIGGGGLGQHVSRDDLIEGLVALLERLVAADADGPDPEQPVRGQLTEGPAPPPFARSWARVAEFGRQDRPSFGDLIEYGLDVLGLLLAESIQPSPRGTAFGPLFVPPHEGFRLDGEQRGLVGPCLEPLVVLVCDVVEHRGAVRPKSREGWHVLGADDHRDRVELDELEPTHELAHVSAVDSTRSFLTEALRAQRQPPSLTDRHVAHRR